MCGRLVCTVPAGVERHAVLVATGEQHVAKVAADEQDAAYPAARAGVRADG
jgi:hypothetical protein